MAIIAAGITAGASALSSFFGGRSARKQQKKQQKLDFQGQKYFVDLARQDALKDRLYKEQAIGAYREFSPRPLMSPAYTDPNTIKPVNPYG